jgi:RHS repeat-associated protein
VTADAHNWVHTSAPDYQYDAAGNMTYDATASLSYTFDQENRLTGAGGYGYIYDADGNRVEKVAPATNPTSGTLYWYMTPGIVAESDLAGNPTSEYIFFGGERVARRDGVNGAGGVFYYFSDHLKTASVITDSAGVIKAESDYYPWGGELQFVNNDTNDYKFTGKKHDVETGLDYFGARYYSNGLGRWVSADWSPTPVLVLYADFGDPQSLNLYGYVRSVPTSRSDADGHQDGQNQVCLAQNSVNNFATKPKDWGEAAIGFGKQIVNKVYDTANLLAGKVGGGNIPLTNADQHIGANAADQVIAAAPVLGELKGASAVASVATAAAPGAIESSLTRGAAESTTLFRGVGSAEAASIESTGSFTSSPTGSEFKGFFFNESDASSFASRMTAMTGDAHSVVSAEAPTNLVSASPTHNAATEGAGVLIKNENLPQVKPHN